MRQRGTRKNKKTKKKLRHDDGVENAGAEIAAGVGKKIVKATERLYGQCRALRGSFLLIKEHGVRAHRDRIYTVIRYVG